MNIESLTTNPLEILLLVKSNNLCSSSTDQQWVFLQPPAVSEADSLSVVWTGIMLIRAA